MIKVENITKTYGIASPSLSLGITIFEKVFFSKKKKFKSLDNVSLHCSKGEIIGIMGRNGSGKTTLLKTICGITSIDSGSVKVQGRIVSLLEVGAGFSMLLTGRENIYLKASLFGIAKKEIEKRVDEIISFSGLEAFIDTPLFQYSSGMFVRLGFSVAVFCNPDILIVDETLAVGDIEFQNKCIDTIETLKNKGMCILFVSHDLAIVNGMCDRVYLLEKGKIIAHGLPQDVIPEYLQYASTEGTLLKQKKGNVEYFFNDGNLAIFYKSKSLTKLYGLYSSIYAYRAWHDSHQASWKIEAQTDDSWNLIGQSRRLPLSYRWKIEFTSNGQFTISQFITSKNDFLINEAQTSILLSKSFTDWTMGKQSGLFPAIPSASWNNWYTLSDPSSESLDQISATSPETNITIHFSKKTESRHEPYAIVTSKDFNSNILQFLDTQMLQTKIKANQEVKIFEAHIEIEEINK